MKTVIVQVIESYQLHEGILYLKIIFVKQSRNIISSYMQKKKKNEEKIRKAFTHPFKLIEILTKPSS